MWLVIFTAATLFYIILVILTLRAQSNGPKLICISHTLMFAGMGWMYTPWGHQGAFFWGSTFILISLWQVRQTLTTTYSLFSWVGLDNIVQTLMSFGMAYMYIPSLENELTHQFYSVFFAFLTLYLALRIFWRMSRRRRVIIEVISDLAHIGMAIAMVDMFAAKFN